MTDTKKGFAMKNNDDLSRFVDALKKREEILLTGQPIKKYNKYFDIKRECARRLIEQNRQDELLPYLESESVSIRADAAGVLFNCYPEKCGEVLRQISEMTVADGLPKQFVIVTAAARCNLKYGIPKDFP